MTWIPVSSVEKPEPFKGVLVSVIDGKRARVERGSYRGSGQWMCENTYGTVLAWQPLPAPYRADGEGANG